MNCTLTANILFQIEHSKNIEFTWSVDTRSNARHAALVMKFDGKPQLIVKYPPEEKSRFSNFFKYFIPVSLVSASVASSVAVFKAGSVIPFNHDLGLKILGTIARFVIANPDAKEKAKQLITSILNMDMKSYDEKLNNTRDFVKKAFGVLEKEGECSEENKKRFEDEMKDIEEEDKKTK